MGVGAYDHYSDTLFLDGSRGYTAADDIKPDFVAPGVDVYGPGRAGTFVRKTVLLLQQRIVPGVRH